MDRQTRIKLRAAKRLLGQSIRKRSAKQQAEQLAKCELRPWLDHALGADEDELHGMIRHSLTADATTTRLMVDLLIEKLRSAEESIRIRATTWLALLGRPAVAALVVKLHRSRSASAGVAAAHALHRIGPLLSLRERTNLIFGLDMAAMKTPHDEVRNACAAAVCKISTVPSNIE